MGYSSAKKRFWESRNCVQWKSFQEGKRKGKEKRWVKMMLHRSCGRVLERCACIWRGADNMDDTQWNQDLMNKASKFMMRIGSCHLKIPFILGWFSWSMSSSHRALSEMLSDQHPHIRGKKVHWRLLASQLASLIAERGNLKILCRIFLWRGDQRIHDPRIQE